MRQRVQQFLLFWYVHWVWAVCLGLVVLALILSLFLNGLLLRKLALVSTRATITDEASWTVNEGDATQKNAPQTHVVQQGESLWKIAEQYYGDGRYYQQIQQENSVSNADWLMVGQELRIPELDTTQASQRSKLIEAAMTDNQYLVQPGDSLWKIAAYKLGDSQQWPELYRENVAVVGRNPDLIHPGQVLFLPPSTPPSK